MIKRFGLSRGVSPREDFKKVGELAKMIEDNGFENLWFIDHQLGMKDVYAAMNVAALSTERIEIGSAVTNLQTRHPTVTANATTALDDMSDGRALLGLGAGWVALHSINKRPSKIAELREGIGDFRKLFSGEEIELYGTELQLATARRQIPIYLAVSQPNMLRLAGEICDGAILMGAADPEFCEWQLKYIYEGLEKAGRDRSDITIDIIITLSADENERKAIEDVAAWATSQAAQFDQWKLIPEGWKRFAPEFKEAVESYHFKEHLSLRAEHKQVVSDEFVQSVAIAGDMDECVNRLRSICELDIDRISFALLSGGRERRIKELANEIIPRATAE
ncbi:MAG: LLM class flavin-dependent oxidoreductase [Woeseiaceae bacterium]